MKSKPSKSGELRDYAVGSLVVDLTDSANREVLFRVRMDTPIERDPATIGATIDAAVAAMFASLPHACEALKVPFAMLKAQRRIHGGLMMIRLATACAIVVCLAAPAMSQSTAKTNMDILSQKIKADKKLVVAQNLKLTDAEGRILASDAYQKDLELINQRLTAAILAYADAYNKGRSPTTRQRSFSTRLSRLTRPRRS